MSRGPRPGSTRAISPAPWASWRCWRGLRRRPRRRGWPGRVRASRPTRRSSGCASVRSRTSCPTARCRERPIHMKRALLFFVKLAVIVGIAVWVAERPGTVTLRWLNWELHSTVGVLILAVVVAATIAALIYRLWRLTIRSPRDYLRRRAHRRRERGFRALTQGMVAVAAGDAEEAKRQARRAATLLNEPPLTLLLAAQAAQLDGDEEAARDYFTRMIERDETAFLGL